MDVSCPKCETIFELDASHLSSGNATLQCSECDNVFRIRSAVENAKRWMLKNESGDITYFTTFDLLHQWMMEQKVSKHDQISRSGKGWVSLDSIGEFAPVFQVLESIRDLLPKSPDKDPVLQIPEVRTQKPIRTRVQTEQQFLNFAEKETPLDVEADAFIFGKNETPPIQDNPRREPTASVRISKPDSTSSALESNWEAEEFGSSDRSQTKKSSGLFKNLFLLAFLSLFIVGIVYLVNMKREKSTISLKTEEVVAKPVENIAKANTLVYSALSEAETFLGQQEKDVWDKRISEIKIPVGEAVAKATSRAKKKSETGNTDAMLSRGLKALQGGNLSLARGSFIHVLDAEPGNSEAVTGMGWVKLETGNATGAAREFRRALSLNPSYGQAYIGLGQALRETGRLKPALEIYSKYLRRFPGGSRAGIARYQQSELRRKLGLDKDDKKPNEEKVTEEKVEEKKPVIKSVEEPKKVDLNKESLNLKPKDDEIKSN